MSYAKHVSTKVTPQSAPIPGSNQVANSAGGFAFAVDDWTRLDRFLILGAEGGSYYAGERKLTIENAKSITNCLLQDGVRAVNRIVEISDGGRAPKNDPAIFALALAAASPKMETRAAAYQAITKVCRIPTHLFQFTEAVKELRGWSRGLRKGIGRYYTDTALGKLAYHMVKYQQRNGMSHSDMLRFCHAAAPGQRFVTGRTKSGKPIYEAGEVTDPRAILFRWCKSGWETVGSKPHDVKELQIVWAFEKAKRATSSNEVAKLIRDYNLPRECVPTQYLTEAAIWEALLEKMPMTAMIRNLATMTRVGLVGPLSDATKTIKERLADAEYLGESRIHPVGVLSALLTYKQGHGERGSNTWNPVGAIVDALDGAFYKTFKNVVPTGKRWLLGLDVSGSMGSGTIAGVPGLTPLVGTAAMALVTAATEENHAFVAFTSTGWHHTAGGRGQYSSMGYNNGITEMSLSPRMRLDTVVKEMQKLPMGGTDCALPMLWATERKVPVDVFVVLTDSETWAGGIHPTQALKEYRNKMGIDSKLIVVGMVSNGFTIADPKDHGMLDCVGFDTTTPQIMAEFARV